MKIANKSGIKVGTLPTHMKFVGGVAPDENGKLPRDADGVIISLAEAKRIYTGSPAPLHVYQVSTFPGTDADDARELFEGIQELGLELQTILMVGGVNPYDPKDEDATVAQLVGGLKEAKEFGVTTVSSTSFEEWMSGRPELIGADYDAAVAQLAKVHARCYEEAGLAGSSVKLWNLEFLRTGEFATFTNIAKASPVISATNKLIGKNVMKLMVDAAHCGDSDLGIEETQVLICDLASRGELGVFHASAKTTRGCLSTDDGWISTLLTTCAETGQLDTVCVELFHHADEALQALRDLDPGHGIDTTDGRSYTETVIDGITNITRRLNNLKARGVL